jgi:hypothetical protein
MSIKGNQFLKSFRINKFCEKVQYNETASWPINSLCLQSKINEMAFQIITSPIVGKEQTASELQYIYNIGM